MRLTHVMQKAKGNRLIILLLICLLVLVIPGSMTSAEEKATENVSKSLALGDLSGKLVIIHTNDTHGADVAVPGKSIGTAGVKQLVDDYNAAGAEVILISAGDAIQGAPLVNLSEGQNAISFMNLAGYDVMVPGNHEFDFGYDNLKKLESQANFTILSSNILDKKSGKPVFTENMIINTSVGEIGIFGLTTPESLTKANPNKVASLNFLAGEDMYKNAQEQVDELKKAGADYIICMAHLGIDEGSKPNRSTDLIDNVKGIDIVIDGHSHSVLNGNEKDDTILVSTGTKLQYVGAIIIDKKKIQTRLISTSEYSKVEKSVNNEINNVSKEIDEILSETFAKTEVFLDGNKDPGVRTQETNLGDFAADAILWAANQSVGGGVDAAITNGGGIRESIKIGDVTMKDMKTVFPFGNTISTVKITGSQLIELLEAATYSTPTSVGAFPQVSGIEFTVDTTTPFVNGEQFPGSTYYAPANPGSRIKNVKVNEKAIELNKVYTIATNDFLAAGGDTYYLLKNLESFNTYVALEDALVKYTTEVLDGVISTAMYGEPKGRTIVSKVPVIGKKPEKIKDGTNVAEAKKDDATVSVDTYYVVKGDCLWTIARKQLGSGTRYVEIYELNKDILKSPDSIHIGQILKIPA